MLAALFGASVTGEARIASPLQARLNHFQCYRVDVASPFRPRRVGLVDQFGRSKALVTRPFSVCPPVAKNGARIANPLAHLACYTLRSSRFQARPIVIRNQFERARRLVLVRPSELCLPSGKRVLPGAAPRPVRGLDHYLCYFVKPGSRPAVRRPILVDQFGRTKPVVAEQARFCAPVRKNGGALLNSRDHLACYALRPTSRFQRRRALIVNQFGKSRVTVVHQDWLCLPSGKRLLAPDLTVSIAEMRTRVVCPGEPGTCVTIVTFTVTNAGSVSTIEPFFVLIEADPGQKKVISLSLLGGASETVTERLGPDGSCYDPDCTVRVTADSGRTIPESNERNNTATRTDRG